MSLVIGVERSFNHLSANPTRHSFPPLCKNRKKCEVDKKMQACEALTFTECSVFSSYRCLKQSLPRLLTGQKTLLDVVAFKFVVKQ